MKYGIGFAVAILISSASVSQAQTMSDLNNATLDCSFEVKGINGMKHGMKMENGKAVLYFPEDSGVSDKKEKEFKACVDQKLES